MASVLNLFSNLVLFWLWQTNNQWRKNTGSLTAMKPWCTLCSFQCFSGNVEEGGSRTWFLRSRLYPSMKPVARGGVLHHSPKHLWEVKGLQFGKAWFSPCSYLSMEGRRLSASLKHMLEKGNRLPCCHLFPMCHLLLTGVRWHTVPFSPLDLNCIPILPSWGHTQASDACYQSNILNAVLSDKMHSISLRT